MPSDPASPDAGDIDVIDREASVLMKRGIQLMEDQRAESVEEALTCFDHALALRSRLPVESIPRLRYSLAACWLNRGDALATLGSRGQHRMAIRAYDEGIALMRSLPLADDPRYPRRLAVGYQNLGLVLQRSGDPAGALGAFRRALDVLEDPQAERVPDRRHMLAAVWLNFANTSVGVHTIRSAGEARDGARRALALVAGAELESGEAADIGIKARHVLCQAIADRLSALQADDDPMPDVHEATDAVDHALALVGAWEQRGVTGFRPLACDLFRFGVRVYAVYQPQFLDEFVEESLDPRRSSSDYIASPELRAAADEARSLVARQTAAE